VKVSTLWARMLVDAAERAGVPRQNLLSGIVDEHGLADVGARLEQAAFERLLLRALDLTGHEDFPLRMAEWASEGAFDVVAHMISHAPTLRHAVDLCGRFGRLISDGTHLRVTERGPVARLTIDFVRAGPRMDRAHAEFLVLGTLRMVQVFGGSAMRVSAVYFEHPKPAHSAQYTRMFAGAERFRQEFTGIEFDAALLDRSHLHQHSRLYDLLLAQAELQLSLLTGDVGLVQRIEEYLLARPASRIPDMRTTARDHGLSVRSLRRRLTEAGLSYRELVRSIVERRATELLHHRRLSLQEAAVALGFADATSFHRAFKRWTGATPGEFRDAAAANLRNSQSEARQR
jgi:AraC-like DNA-binding protein